MSFFGDAPAELLYAMPGPGQAVTNTVTSGTVGGGPLLGGGGGGAASVIPPCEIPHNYFSKVGKSVLVEGYGIYGVGSSIPTLKFSLWLDNALGTPGTFLCGTGAFTSADTTSGRTAMAFNFRTVVTAAAIGVSGSLQAWGWLNWGMVTNLTTTVATPNITYIMNSGTSTSTTGPGPSAFNTSQSTPVYLEPYASWSTSSTGPTITLQQMFVWGLN